MTHSSKLYIEFTILFIIAPIISFILRDYLAYFFLPFLFLLTLFCVRLLLNDATFKRKRFINLKKHKKQRQRIYQVFFFGAIFTSCFYASLNHNSWFALPINATEQWLWLLVLYPLVSVLPQELIFRTYFFHRYQTIFKHKSMVIWINAAVFSLAHLIYANWIAVTLAFLGGLLFAYTYAKSKSTLACVVEHSIWGIWMFSMGLGQYLDAGIIA